MRVHARMCVCVCFKCALFALAERDGEKEEEVKHLAVKHFNQGASNPAWPTLSSIIDACLSQADESLSHSSGPGILPSYSADDTHLHKSHAGHFSQVLA